MIRVLVLAALVISIPASAQTFRDKKGDPQGYLQQQGDRTYRRDNAGNPQGYSKRRPDGTIEFRTNAGNLIGTEKPIQRQ